VFDSDRQWFLKHQEELKARYSGQFVAILDGKVVDSSPNFDELATRVYEKHGYRDIFMPWVGEEKRPARIPSPRVSG